MPDNKKTFLKKLFFTLALSQLFFAYSAFAQTTDTQKYSGAEATIKQYLCTPTLGNSSGSNKASTDLYNCVNRLYRFAIVVAATFGVFFIVIAGYIYMSADGSGEAVDKAKSILATSITSLIILFAGYIILKALNPDLIAFQNVQPPSVKVSTSTYETISAEELAYIANRDASGAVIGIKGAAGGTVTEVKAAGCDFQTTKQEQEIGQLVMPMYQKLLSLCKIVALTGNRPKISSVIGADQHASNSLHYRGCAVDFANNDKNYTNSAVGKAVIQAANSVQLRINPGSDADQTYHVHVDLDKSCPSLGQR